MTKRIVLLAFFSHLPLTTTNCNYENAVTEDTARHIRGLQTKQIKETNRNKKNCFFFVK